MLDGNAETSLQYSRSSDDVKVLLISYLFPPAGGITVQRALSLARYLPENDCELRVLSARNAPAPVKDPELLQLVPAHVGLHHAWTPVIPFALGQKLWRVFRGRGAQQNGQRAAGGSRPISAKGGLVRRLLSPDPEVLWRPFCFYEAARLIVRHGIEVVVITAPPFSSLLTGVSLKRRFPQITLVSDFRDGWLDWYLDAFEYFGSTAMRTQAVKMEQAVVEASDLVVSVTASLRDKLANRYSTQPDAKFALVPNGFDPAVQPHVEAEPRQNGNIQVTYMGTVYGQTSARYYLDALDELPEDIRGAFETHFIGRIAVEEVPVQHNRRSRVTVHGFLPQREALRRLASSDILLVNMTDPLCHTGKIFEYLATGKPILAFTPPDGELAQILKRVGGAWIVDPADRPAALRTLQEIYSVCRSGAQRPRPEPALVQEFERPRLTRRYAELIRQARRSIG